MSVKNSAGVKFNDNTELIIQADPDGTVESVFNKSNNTEYVGGGSFPVESTTLTVTSAITGGTSQSLAYPTPTVLVPGYIRAGYSLIAYGQTLNYPILKGGTIQAGNNQKWTDLTGECELLEGSSDRILLVNGISSATLSPA